MLDNSVALSGPVRRLGFDGHAMLLEEGGELVNCPGCRPIIRPATGLDG